MAKPSAKIVERRLDVCRPFTGKRLRGYLDRGVSAEEIIVTIRQAARTARDAELAGVFGRG
ncbi:MAG: hypothetical protein HY608_10300 [Planctomycetes bacterium]|nr:hypothetical protein [Planctomycetota bacterium]